MSTSQPTGKEKASRIPLDYHRRADPLLKTRLWLTALATLAALGFVAWGFLAPAGATQHSHGPVATPHALWESDCQKCHVPFRPIRGDAWLASWTSGQSERTQIHASDARCQACHGGPAHAAREKPEEVASCSSCHVEHQGRPASLVRVGDHACTRCHANLEQHTSQAPRADAVKIHGSIASWEQGHPDFQSLQKDPGTIKFTHARHMSAGMRTAPDDRVQLKLADLSPADRDRYRRPGQGDNDLVQLDCSSCHQADAASGETADRSLAAPGSGAYMLPISFDQHCRACHPLTIDPQQPDVVLAHGLQPGQIREVLLGQLTQRLMADAPQAWEERIKPPVPTRKAEQQPRPPLDLVTQQVLKAERHLRLQCGKCHEFDRPPDAAPLPVSLVPVELSQLMEAVKPAGIPQVWLQRARFDHAAHRVIDCRACHERAYANHPQASRNSSDVLIAGRDNCLRCHSTRHMTAEGPRGGARQDCAECHVYHGADQPPHGRGWDLRDALTKRSPPELLRGGPP